MTLLEQESTTSVAIKNILFATDFSEASEAALPYVAAFSSCFGSHIHITHVLPEVTFLRPGSPDPGVIGSIYEDAHKRRAGKDAATGEEIEQVPADFLPSARGDLSGSLKPGRRAADRSHYRRNAWPHRVGAADHGFGGRRDFASRTLSGADRRTKRNRSSSAKHGTS